MNNRVKAGIGALIGFLVFPILVQVVIIWLLLEAMTGDEHAEGMLADICDIPAEFLKK